MKYPDSVRASSVCLDKYCLHLQKLRDSGNQVYFTSFRIMEPLKNLQTRMSTKNSLVFSSSEQAKAQVVVDEVSQKC